MEKNTIARLARKLYVKMQIQEMLPLEKYEIFVKPEFDSASWHFSNGKHQVVIGTDIFNNMASKGTDTDKALYMRSYLYHELAHSIWTDIDLNAINKKLKVLGFSFSMFNLFEDARIEEKMRHHIKKRFNWSKYEKMNVAENPIEIFYYLIQSEHNKKARDSIQVNLGLGVEHHFDTVVLFYKKAIQCESSAEIIELLKKWYDKFPSTPKYEDENVLKSYIFSMESKYVDGEKFAELIQGLDNLLVGETSDEDKKETTQKEEQTRNLRLKIKQNNEESLLSPTPVEVAFDEKMRNRLLDKMKKIFLSPARMSSTMLPSKRLSIKNIVAKNHKIFKRRDKINFVKKSITIVLDLSGSMYTTIGSMRLVLDVLDKMVRKNLLNVTLILSGVTEHQTLWERYTLPLEEGVLERIVPIFWAEGLNNALSCNLNNLKKSDYVWVFTDGMICEGPLDKTFYQNHKIKLHAFYIGDIQYKQEMEDSFDYIICAKNVQSLTNEIFKLVT